MSYAAITAARPGAVSTELDLPTPPEWVALALCAETDPEAYFPEPGNTAGAAASTKLALRVCALCDVREQCLDYANEQRIPHGIWGGQTARQRMRARRGEPARPPQLKAVCKRGHDLIGANVRVRADGARACRKCEADNHRARKARLAAEEVAA